MKESENGRFAFMRDLERTPLKLRYWVKRRRISSMLKLMPWPRKEPGPKERRSETFDLILS